MGLGGTASPEHLPGAAVPTEPWQTPLGSCSSSVFVLSIVILEAAASGFFFSVIYCHYNTKSSRTMNSRGWRYLPPVLQTKHNFYLCSDFWMVQGEQGGRDCWAGGAPPLVQPWHSVLPWSLWPPQHWDAREEISFCQVL